MFKIALFHCLSFRLVLRLTERSGKLLVLSSTIVVMIYTCGWLSRCWTRRDGWELNVMLVDGVLYLEEHVSDARLQEKYVLSVRL